MLNAQLKGNLVISNFLTASQSKSLNPLTTQAAILKKKPASSKAIYSMT
jgi:hypothetical protein